MRLPLIVAFNIVVFLNPLYADKQKKPTRNVEVTAEDEKIRDAAGFEAIKEIHRLMDDDQSGSIDRFESNDFLSEDLQITGNDRAQRERAFHHDDDAITVDDMWESWFESNERTWDEETVLHWLINCVRLPQYKKNFTENKVAGVSLPRMAVQNSSYLSSVLGIKSYVHRQKLQIKALDLVLFGFHEVSQSKTKDIFIALLAVICTACAVYMKRLHGTSKKHVAALTKKLTEITSMETDFRGVEKRFDGEETASIRALKEKLHDAEKRLEMSGPDAVSFALQPLLRRTYEIEVTSINEKKVECLTEMREAKDFVDRIRKKQSGIMNSIKLAAGATITGADTVDAKVYSLRSRMEQISATMAECQERWIKIESTCGFSIAGPYGIPKRINGNCAPGVQTPLMSTSGSRKNSPPPLLSSIAPTPATDQPVFTLAAPAYETPPTTVTFLPPAVPKFDIPPVTYPELNQLSEDLHSLASSRSSGSIGKKINKFFYWKKNKP